MNLNLLSNFVFQTAANFKEQKELRQFAEFLKSRQNTLQKLDTLQN